MQKPRVLFLCTGNSARSQMAEAWLRRLGGDHFHVNSAGLDPKGVHPLTVRVMEEAGFDMRAHYSKKLADFLNGPHFSYLITVCSSAEEKCPVFPGMGQRLHWPLDDPAAAQGSEDEQLAAFRRARDEIGACVQEWLLGMGIEPAE